VLPILQQHCQTCHRAGGIGPMGLETYEQARSKAQEIREKVEVESRCRRGLPIHGTATSQTILRYLAKRSKRWWRGVEAGAPAGKSSDAPAPRQWPADGVFRSRTSR